MDKNGTTADSGEDRLSNIKEQVKGFVDKGQERASEIKARVLEVKDQAVTRGNAMLDQAETFIRANPMKAVGIAFGIGYVGMRLFRR